MLTVPHEVRRVLALRPDALTAQGRIFVEEIARWQKHAARTSGETGAVTFVQRFNSILGWRIGRPNAFRCQASAMRPDASCGEST